MGKPDSLRFSGGPGLPLRGQLERGWKWAGAILWDPQRKNGPVGVACGMQGQASDSAPHMTLPSTLSPVLGSWPDQNLQAIYQSLGCDCVEIKGAYVHGAMVLKWHACALTNHVPVLLMQRELLALTEAEVEGKGDGKLGRLTGMGFVGWVFLSRPWDPSWFCKGIRKVSDVDDPFSVSCPSASSRAPSSGRARNRASYRARGDPGSVSTVACSVRASLPSVSASRTASRAPFFCRCAG